MNDDGLPKCRHRGGEFAPGRWSCGSSRLVAAKGVTRHVCREVCPWRDHEVEAAPRGPTLADLGSGYGVAIGTFDSLDRRGKRYGTEAVKLGLAVLRATCGKSVRILVCDDASPEPSQRRYRALCEKYDAEFTTNPVRMGHTSGDMIVFHKAIHWARGHGLRTVTKLSHRMMIDVENWVQTDSERLLSSPFATQTQMLTNFGFEQIRTECVMMAVKQWFSSGVLEHYRPRRIPYWNESHTFEAISRLVDAGKPYPHFLPWPRIAFVRGADRPPVFFREMEDADNRFRTLARKHDVLLSPDFSTADSCSSADYQ